MSNNKLSLILLNQYNKAIKQNNPNLTFLINENDIKIWYILIKGLDDEFKDGEYIFKITAPNEFPHKPPSLECYTPNGVYDIGGKICISVGEFHANDNPGKTGGYGWRPSLGMMGFATEVLNGLINYQFLEYGIRILSTDKNTKIKLAKESSNYNKKHYPELFKEESGKEEGCKEESCKEEGCKEGEVKEEGVKENIEDSEEDPKEAPKEDPKEESEEDIIFNFLIENLLD